MNRLVWIIDEQPNPSTDYYLLPLFSSLGWEAVRFFHGDRLPRSMPAGQAIVFVRYVPAAWIKFIEKFREDIDELVFFMDDDVLDISESRGLPLRYRLKLVRLSAGRRAWIKRMRCKMWVSTPYLLEKYAAWNPSLVPPSPISPQKASTVFYHGSATHEAEIRWLRPVIEKVTERDDQAHFELIGGPDVKKLYRGMQRVTVVHPMKWPAYQKFLAMPGRVIGLAPVLKTRFNKARSYTKFFDITRSGAAGIYSKESVFNSIIDHGAEGFLQANDEDEWVEAIVRLLKDPGLRSSLARNAERKASELMLSARESYQAVF